MDINKLVDVLRATLQPDQREAAEKHLTEVMCTIRQERLCIKCETAKLRTRRHIKCEIKCENILQLTQTQR